MPIHFDVNPDYTPSFTCLEIRNIFIFIHSIASLHCFIFLVIVIGVMIYNFLTQYI
jgi:hypothetical protein